MISADVRPKCGRRSVQHLSEGTLSAFCSHLGSASSISLASARLCRHSLTAAASGVSALQTTPVVKISYDIQRYTLITSHLGRIECECPEMRSIKSDTCWTHIRKKFWLPTKPVTSRSHSTCTSDCLTMSTLTTYLKYSRHTCWQQQHFTRSDNLHNTHCATSIM